MKKLKIKFISQYRKSGGDGSVTFVYGVTGTPEELAKYKAHKADNFRELKADENGSVKGTALFFSKRYVGANGEIMETSDKRWVLDTTEADKLINMTAQCGGNVELAKELLKQEAAQ